MNKWKFVCHNWTFLFPVRGMQLPQMMQWVNLKSGTFEKYWKSWSQSLWMCLVCVLPWRRKKLILLKARYLHFCKVPAVHPDLIGQDLSASECSWLGTSAALAQAHTVFQYHGERHRTQLYTGTTPEEVEMFINSVGQKSADTGWSSSMPQN